ncbi:MAG: dephospho-CoA kinase [Candidatus Brocadiaceae bacterium]|nr:dephospho-CoA kinase [Candidatus Brocadiaceae bacterium]
MTPTGDKTRRAPVIGLVGGLAAGKSTVARLMRERGACVVDADRIGHEVLELPHVRTALTDAFGHGILGPDGRVDRGRLAAVAFGTPERVERLNGIVHPIIIQRISDLLREFSARPDVPLVALDAPLLMETQLHRDVCRALLYVEAPEDERRRRAAQNRGIAPEQFAVREQAQMPTDVKAAVADYTVINTGSIEELARQIDRIWPDLCRLSGGV